MERTPSTSAADLAELSLLAVDSFDEGDLAPVAGPCPDFFPQEVAAGRVAMAGTSTAEPVREGSAGAVQTSGEDAVRTTQRPAMVVAADGAAVEAVDGGCGPGAVRTTGGKKNTIVLVYSGQLDNQNMAQT
uniref:Uncharacterized protein LOC117357492 isoform X6 n=1 Tax=Geotrypetes seraphini TaxID=260995 RepID=A0A6P8R285_GEOSA|nr:uncharacterized protein LOC117357492 isoform X6 [Geotrypetes seraphini]